MRHIKPETQLLIESELTTACERWGDKFASTHEGYAVILEELDESFDEIKANNNSKLKQELVQVAAMTIKLIEQL